MQLVSLARKYTSGLMIAALDPSLIFYMHLPSYRIYHHTIMHRSIRNVCLAGRVTEGMNAQFAYAACVALRGGLPYAWYHAHL